MKIPSRGSPDFWSRYRALPGTVQKRARKNYWLWHEDASHPSLRFKRIGHPFWSARVGDHYRAVGAFEGCVFVWEWIGSHEEYNKRF